MSGPRRPRYTSKIIKAGALLADSRTFLQEYDETLSPAENLRRFQHENVFGKASRSRVADILPIFRQRFLDDERLARPLRMLARGRVPADVIDRILYFHAAHNDRLLYDFVARFLFPRSQSGLLEVRGAEARRFLAALVERDGTRWGAETTERVARGLLSALRDFRLLEGAVRKRIAPIHLPLEAFLYVACAIHAGGPSGEQLLRHADWRLFLLESDDVERLFLEAHRRHLLSYQAAGRIVRVDFGARTLEEVAGVLAA